MRFQGISQIVMLSVSTESENKERLAKTISFKLYHGVIMVMHYIKNKVNHNLMYTAIKVQHHSNSVADA